MDKRLQRVVWISAIAGVVALGLYFVNTHKQVALPLYGKDVTTQNWQASFTLNDAIGHKRELREFRGKMVVITFGYTHCPDACPTTLSRLARMQHLLGSDAAKVQVIFATIDPERDTAALLDNYVKAFDPTFLALRGDEAQTDAATRAFHANYNIVLHDQEVLVEHTVDTYIVDTEGRVRVVLPYEFPAAEAAKDVRLLLGS